VESLLYYDGVTEISRKLQKAYPELIKLESIGKSYENREIWVLTVTNLKNGNHLEKPGFYIDGNIHASELQGTEISLYTVWYLVENYYENQFIRELLDEKVFYIIPTTNPDGRENYMKQPNTVSSPRSGTVPVDDDGDGLIDEDTFDDLNGDGHITQMRRRSPNGNFNADPEDPV
jgi:murein tripeptide amidase MpaA